MLDIESEDFLKRAEEEEWDRYREEGFPKTFEPVLKQVFNPYTGKKDLFYVRDPRAIELSQKYNIEGVGRRGDLRSKIRKGEIKSGIVTLKCVNVFSGRVRPSKQALIEEHLLRSNFGPLYTHKGGRRFLENRILKIIGTISGNKVLVKDINDGVEFKTSKYKLELLDTIPVY